MTPFDVVPAPPAAAEAEPPPPPTLSADDVAGARSFVDASRAASTRKAYAADWRRFSQWCHARNAPALPANPALVAVYLSALSLRGLAPPSVGRALAAIAHMHRRAGLVAPHRGADGAVVAEVLAGIRRSRTDAPDKKLAADADVVMQLLWSITGDSLAALRDRALIAFGMALAARRSELVALDMADLAWEPKGLRVTIRRSKSTRRARAPSSPYPRGAASPPSPTCGPGLRPPGSPKARCSGRCGRAQAGRVPVANPLGKRPEGAASKGPSFPLVKSRLHCIGGCATRGCPTTPSPASCRRAPPRPASTPRATPGTACARAS